VVNKYFRRAHHKDTEIHGDTEEKQEQDNKGAPHLLAWLEKALLLSRFVIITTDGLMLVWFELLIGCSGRPSSWSAQQLRVSHFDCQSRAWDWRRGRSYRNRSIAVSKSWIV